MTFAASEKLVFGEFELLPSQRMLRGREGPIELRPTSLSVLIYLVSSAGRVVSKEELLDAIWPDVTVSEESLTRCVSDIRSALSDGERRMLKTVSRRGYLFAAEVETGPSKIPTPARRKSMALTAMFGILALIVALLGTWALSSAQPKIHSRPLLAVLPLEGAATEADDDYFADGLTEDISLALSRFGSILVIAQSSTVRFKGSTASIRDIGDQLNARFLLTGSTRRDDARIILNLQLTDVADGVQVWSGQYDGEVNGFFGAKTALVGTIASILDRQITKVELDRIARSQPPDMTAYDLVLQGDALLRNTEGRERGENIATARDLYERAAAIDPRYSEAVEGIANTYLLAWLEPHSSSPLAGEFQTPNALKWAGDYARKAVELDETSATARATLGWILNWQSGPSAGLTLYDQALQLNPGLVDWRYGLLLSHGGRAEEAEAYMKQIMISDPLHPPRYRYLLGKAYYFQGRYDEGLPLIRQAAAQMPAHQPSHVLLAALLAEIGETNSLKDLVAEVNALVPGFTVEKWLAYIRISDEAYADRLRRGLLAAGFPET
ncbi:winged helix-turn-helix domain-containing protein [Frigidibacter sp. RF13]|uniref:winged helix-turn-helix domain-containing protein n=1 Tax=Frigidibacter sp. RF13 TaxID=2997340 RepID=UPI00226E6813|nr:winged helix-turn-helix domain-containing protein [Frigidibacter sp. RF13]MCY1126581.1 winged helix-turn-helix domain-containing protein [Frigidibacter sp. RF13]